MISLIKDKKVKEFGDFQTPRELAFEVCLLLSKLNIQPQSVVEPNCGLGSFVQAAKKIFFSSEIHGFDVSPKYVEFAKNKFDGDERISISKANFFQTDWKKTFEKLPKPIFWTIEKVRSTKNELDSQFSELAIIRFRLGKWQFRVSIKN